MIEQSLGPIKLETSSYLQIWYSYIYKIYSSTVQLFINQGTEVKSVTCWR